MMTPSASRAMTARSDAFTRCVPHSPGAGSVPGPSLLKHAASILLVRGTAPVRIYPNRLLDCQSSAGVSQFGFEECHQVRLALQADLLCHELAVPEEHDRWHPAYTELVWRLLVLVDVERCHGNSIRILPGNLVDG